MTKYLDSLWFWAIMIGVSAPGCNRATPKLTVTPEGALYAISEVSEELVAGGKLVMTFPGAVPQFSQMQTVSPTIKRVNGATQIYFVSESGRKYLCSNPVTAANTVTCDIPSDLPVGSNVRISFMDSVHHMAAKNGVTISFVVLSESRRKTNLVPPRASSTFFVSSTTRVGNTLSFFGKGFLANGPIQFYFGAVGGDVTEPCFPNVFTDTEATCLVPTWLVGKKAFWGEALNQPHQFRSQPLTVDL